MKALTVSFYLRTPILELTSSVGKFSVIFTCCTSYFYFHIDWSDTFYIFLCLDIQAICKISIYVECSKLKQISLCICFFTSVTVVYVMNFNKFIFIFNWN